MFGTTAAIFSLLLIATGAAKAASPEDTDRAIRSMGLRVPNGSARLLGLAEIGIGLFALIGLSPIFWFAQGFLYASFLAWMIVAMARSLPIESCGCLGTPDTPPYWGHLLIDSIAVVVSVGAGVGGTVFLADAEFANLVTQLVLVAVGGFLAWTVIGDGARLYGAVHE